MKMRIILLASLLHISPASFAALNDLGNGLIEDTTQSINWLQDANLVKTACDASAGIEKDLWDAFAAMQPSVSDRHTPTEICNQENGMLNWFEAMAWVDILNQHTYLGHNNWRLPETSQPDPSCSSQSADDSPLGYGYNCTGSELGHLFRIGLGNQNTGPSCSPNCFTQTEPFINTNPTLSPNAGAAAYWSKSEVPNPFPPTFPSPFVWWFATDTGSQDSSFKDANFAFVWPVNTGSPTSGDITPPTAPSNLNATNTTDTTTDLSWDAATDADTGVVAYTIYKDGVFEKNSTSISTHITGLASGTAYNFTVKARDGAGNLSSVSNTASITTTGIHNPCEQDPDLVARYSLDSVSSNTVVDQSGNGHDGTVSGATPSAGRVASALDFDGDNDFVSINSFDISGNQLSLVAWIRADDFATADARIISKATGVQENDHIWMLSTISDNGIKPRFRLKTGSTTHTLIGTQTLNPNTWYHIVATYDGSKMRLYIDGVEKGGRTKTGNIASSSAGIRIGDNPIEARHFDGTIDEVNLYSKALSLAEVTALKNGESPTSCPDNPTILGECDGVTPSTPPKGECDGVAGVDINDVICTINKVLSQ
jgi:chitodextrinase